jgi:hypothetical protein
VGPQPETVVLVELAFFDGDNLLCRGKIRCRPSQATKCISGADSQEFLVTYGFEAPTCPLTIHCTRSGEHLYQAALRMGIHISGDWESINLGNVRTLALRCVADRKGAAREGAGGGAA